MADAKIIGSLAAFIKRCGILELIDDAFPPNQQFFNHVRTFSG